MRMKNKPEKTKYRIFSGYRHLEGSGRLGGYSETRSQKIKLNEVDLIT